MKVSRSSPALPRLAASFGWACLAPQPQRGAGHTGAFYSALQTCGRPDQRQFSSSARTPVAANLSGLKDYLKISDEVADAIATNKPVVALETTIYTHGAFQEDLGLEEIVRERGAVPAVCGVYNGVATVGLEKHEIEEMVQSKASKLSRRDFAAILADARRPGGSVRHGGTTIAGTMILARLAGIRVFGTGGLGGVHRGGENSMDISADLTELGRTRVAVISSGCKGFLDIPRTLEYLETQGVVVATFAETSKQTFPAFWARDSGIPSPNHVFDSLHAAHMIYAQEKLGLESGLLLANPIPAESAIPREVMEDAIDRAVQDAEREGHTGSSNTPFILRQIKKYTENRSVGANLALVRNNVSRAADVARWLSVIDKHGPSGFDPADFKDIPIQYMPDWRYVPSSRSESSTAPASERKESLTSGSPVNFDAIADRQVTRAGHPQPDQPSRVSQQGQPPDRDGTISKNDERVDLVVAGSVALDLSCDYIGVQSGAAANSAESPQMHTSNPASISQSVGGVGHNVALAAHRFGGGDVKVKLCSVVGDDVAGSTLLDAIRDEGLSTSDICKLGNGARTAQYVSVNDSHKSLVLAMADMDILNARPPPMEYWVNMLRKCKPRIVVVDANWEPSTIRSIMWAARHTRRRTPEGRRRAETVFEPVSVAKSTRLFEGDRLSVYPRLDLTLTTPNVYELLAMYDAARERGYFHDSPPWAAVIESFNIRGGTEFDYNAYFDELMSQTSPEIRAAGVPQKVLHLLPYFGRIVVKFGRHGCLLAEIMRNDDVRLVMPKHLRYILTKPPPGSSFGDVKSVYMRYYPPIKVASQSVVSVNGAGDTFLGALVACLSTVAYPLSSMIQSGQQAAVMTLKSKEAVASRLADVGRLFLDGVSRPQLQVQATVSDGVIDHIELDDGEDAGDDPFGSDTTVHWTQDGSLRDMTTSPAERTEHTDEIQRAALEGAAHEALTQTTQTEQHSVSDEDYQRPKEEQQGVSEEERQDIEVDGHDILTAAILGAKQRADEGEQQYVAWEIREDITPETQQQDAPIQLTPATQEEPNHSPPTTRDIPTTEPPSPAPLTTNTPTPIPRPTIPVAERIHEALAKMGVSKEHADEAIRAVAAGGPHVFAKWKAEYTAKMKARADVEARKAAALRMAEFDRQFADRAPGWGAIKKKDPKGLRDTLLPGGRGKKAGG